MRRVVPLLVLFLMAAPMARAQVLVELFTSQGCSSCPPADALLEELSGRDDVIALAFHVDYWDYLGWKDTFARPEFTARQQAYSRKVDRQYIGRKLRGSFTPEVVIGGYDSLVGSSRQGIVSRIVAHRDMARKVELDLARSEGQISVRLQPIAADVPRTRIMLASVRDAAVVDVERGENRGRKLTYHRIVEALKVLGNWDGASTAELTAPDPGGTVVVFLQAGKAGPVLAVAEVN